MKKVLLVAFGVVSAILILLITGSVDFYSRISNCTACHEMKQSYESWKTSSHSSVHCNSCHRRNPSEGMFSSEGTAISRIIDHFAKAKKDPKAHVSKENCLSCHSSIKKRIKTNSNNLIVSSMSLHISAGYTCTHCHKDFVHEKNTESGSSRADKQMKNCISCHKREEVSVECETCHYGTQDHVDRIAQRSGYKLKKGEDCKVCHTEKDSNKTNHKKAMQNVGGYKGLETCDKCHVCDAKEVENSVHSRLKTKVTHIPGIKEQMGMADKAAFPSTWAYQLERKNGTVKSSGCGQCHVGASALPTPEMASKIDCLICHAEKYDMKKRHVIKVGTAMRWVGDESTEAATSIGKPKAEYCWRCHEQHMEHKRGTPYTAKTDVHAKAGIPCQSCHIVIKHKTARGSVADVKANDIPELSIECGSCHFDYKHDIKGIDVHLNRMACQTCHIAKVSGMVVWDHTTAVDKDKDGLFDDGIVEQPQVKPIFLWFNGTANEYGWPVGNRNDKKAKIYPYKTYKLIMPLDATTKKWVPSSPSVLAKTGNFDLSVKMAAKFMGLPQPPKWIKVESVSVKQLSHAIDKKGLACNDCHSKKGIMDFKALGYSGDEVKKLSEPQSY